MKDHFYRQFLEESQANGNLVCMFLNRCDIPFIVHSISFTLRASGGVYHGQGSLGLLQHGLREHGQVDALWNLYCSSIQVGNYDVQLVKTRSIVVAGRTEKKMFKKSRPKTCF